MTFGVWYEGKWRIGSKMYKMFCELFVSLKMELQKHSVTYKDLQRGIM